MKNKAFALLCTHHPRWRTSMLVKRSPKAGGLVLPTYAGYVEIW